MPLSHLEKASLTVRRSVTTCGWGGSAVHVRLALRHRSRKIGVTDAELKSTDMVGELLGKGQRVADQPCNALPQRIVETFDVIGFTRSFADRLVLR